MSSQVHPESRAVAALLAVLPPAATVAVIGADVTVNGTRLDVEWFGSGRLSDANRLIDQSTTRNTIVGAARHWSPGARRALDEHRTCWVDETGAAQIAVGSVVIALTGQPPPVPPKTPRWTRSALGVAEVLLSGTPATVDATKRATGLSTGSVTKALATLTDLGLLERDQHRGRVSGRRVHDADALLAEYSAAATGLGSRAELVVGLLARDLVASVVELGAAWEREQVEWAATGALASTVMAPVLTSLESAVVYIDSDSDSLSGLTNAARVAGLTPIKGGRLTLRTAPTAAVCRAATTVNGMQCAPWARVYADLQHVGVRGEEAGEHLREVMTNER